MPNVSIIIPSYNGRHLLAECLPALMKQTYSAFELIIIDNGSSDGTVTWLANEYPQVRVIENQENKGFAPAVNQGIRSTDLKYVVTLNNDIVVDDDWLKNLVLVAEGDASLGMCASKLVFWHQSSVINSSGVCVDRAGIVWDRDGGTPETSKVSDDKDVFGPCAGAALYKRAMLAEIGLFDETYFAYFEDVDLAWRARASGWRCQYVDKARGRHHHSSTSVNGSRFKNYQLGRNKVRLIIKNYPFRSLWWYVPIILLYDILAVSYQLFVHKNWETLRGRCVGWWHVFDALAARPVYEDRQDVPFISGITWPWLVWKRFRYISEMRLDYQSRGHL